MKFHEHIIRVTVPGLPCEVTREELSGELADFAHRPEHFLEEVTKSEVVSPERRGSEPGSIAFERNIYFGHLVFHETVQIGADVPYCIMRGTALAEGIGEKLTRLPQLPKCYILIGKPGVNVSTKLAYENLDLGNLGARPDIDGMIADIENGDIYSMISRMGNVFEPGIIAKYPVIQEIKDLMEKHGALKSMMSGSGPTVFGIFDDKNKMKTAARILRSSHLARTVFATEVFNRRN